MLSQYVVPSMLTFLMWLCAREIRDPARSNVDAVRAVTVIVAQSCLLSFICRCWIALVGERRRILSTPLLDAALASTCKFQVGNILQHKYPEFHFAVSKVSGKLASSLRPLDFRYTSHNRWNNQPMCGNIVRLASVHNSKLARLTDEGNYTTSARLA